MPSQWGPRRQRGKRSARRPPSGRCVVLGLVHPPGKIVPMKTDAELLAAVRSGDMAAAGDLFEAHRAAGVRYAGTLADNGDAEELEGAVLDRGEFRIEHEGCLRALRHGHGVSGDRGEVGKEGAEAVDRQSVVGALGRGLSTCGVGAFGLCDDGGAGGLGCGLVVVVE